MFTLITDSIYHKAIPNSTERPNTRCKTVSKLALVAMEILIPALGALMILKGGVLVSAHVTYGGVLCGAAILPEIGCVLLVLQHYKKSKEEPKPEEVDEDQHVSSDHHDSSTVDPTSSEDPLLQVEDEEEPKPEEVDEDQHVSSDHHDSSTVDPTSSEDPLLQVEDEEGEETESDSTEVDANSSSSSEEIIQSEPEDVEEKESDLRVDKEPAIGSSSSFGNVEDLTFLFGGSEESSEEEALEDPSSITESPDMSISDELVEEEELADSVSPEPLADSLLTESWIVFEKVEENNGVFPLNKEELEGEFAKAISTEDQNRLYGVQQMLCTLFSTNPILAECYESVVYQIVTVSQQVCYDAIMMSLRRGSETTTSSILGTLHACLTPLIGEKAARPISAWVINKLFLNAIFNPFKPASYLPVVGEMIDSLDAPLQILILDGILSELVPQVIAGQRRELDRLVLAKIDTLRAGYGMPWVTVAGEFLYSKLSSLAEEKLPEMMEQALNYLNPNGYKEMLETAMRIYGGGGTQESGYGLVTLFSCELLDRVATLGQSPEEDRGEAISQMMDTPTFLRFLQGGMEGLGGGLTMAMAEPHVRRLTDGMMNSFGAALLPASSTMVQKDPESGLAVVAWREELAEKISPEKLALAQATVWRYLGDLATRHSNQALDHLDRQLAKHFNDLLWGIIDRVDSILAMAIKLEPHEDRAQVAKRIADPNFDMEAFFGEFTTIVNTRIEDVSEKSWQALNTLLGTGGPEVTWKDTLLAFALQAATEYLNGYFENSPDARNLTHFLRLRAAEQIEGLQTQYTQTKETLTQNIPTLWAALGTQLLTIEVEKGEMDLLQAFSIMSRHQTQLALNESITKIGFDPNLVEEIPSGPNIAQRAISGIYYWWYQDPDTQLQSPTT